MSKEKHGPISIRNMNAVILNNILKFNNIQQLSLYRRII